MPTPQKAIERIQTSRLALSIGVGTFIYACIAAMFVQLVLIPAFLPHHQDGAGIFEGIDTAGFHTEGAKLAEKIKENGWQEWRLRPKGQAPAGVLAGIYAVFSPNFYYAIPFNAIVHALSAVALFFISFCIHGSRFAALLGSLYFVLLPSNSMLYTQMHKDGLYILGVFCVILSLVTKQRDFKSTMIPIGLSVFGFLSMWTQRPYVADILLLVGSVIFLYLFFWLFLRGRRIFATRKITVAFAIILVALALKTRDAEDQALFDGSPPSSSAMFDLAPEYSPKNVVVKSKKIGVPADWGILHFLVFKINTITELRYINSRAFKNASTNIDTHIIPKTLGEFFFYLPKAYLNALLAPYPWQSFTPGSTNFRSILKKIVGIEVLVIYVFLVFFLLYLYRTKFTFENIATVVFCSVFLLLLGYAFTNSGTVYRMRCGFVTVFVAIGIGEMVRRWLPSDKAMEPGQPRI